MKTEPLEIELTESTLAALAIEAHRAGVTLNEIVVSKIQGIMDRRSDAARSDGYDIAITHRFSRDGWARMEKKAKLAGCSVMAMLNTAWDLLADTDELVSLWLPQEIVNKLWLVAGAADLDADEIGKVILGDLTADPACFKDLIANTWPTITVAESAAIDAVLAGWEADAAA